MSSDQVTAVEPDRRATNSDYGNTPTLYTFQLFSVLFGSFGSWLIMTVKYTRIDIGVKVVSLGLSFIRSPQKCDT